jgi:hypothetical protein
MKALKLFTTVFAVCFIAGLAVVLVAPTPSLADEDPCNRDCYRIDCGPGSCPPPPVGGYPIVKCYQYNPPTWECEGPYACGCHQIGCGSCPS